MNTSPQTSKQASVGKTILKQMGGAGRLTAMLGVRQFIDLRGRGVGFKWPNKQRSRGNYVEIELTGADLYDMTFFNVSKRGKKKVKEFKGLFFDMLVETFESHTGWYLRMASVERVLEKKQASVSVERVLQKMGASQYRKLSDAAEATGNPAYAGSGSKIWYYKARMGRDMGMGYEWLVERGGEDAGMGNVPHVPTYKTLAETHVLIGEIGERNLDSIFTMMQGEMWSPRGEARGLISKSGSGHTSMSVGDIVMQGRKLWFVDNMGFKELK